MKKFLLILTVALFATATYAQTQTQIPVKDLPKAATEYIAKTYPDYTIEKAFKVDTKGVITYDVLIWKPKDATTRIGLVFDSTGKFLKKYTPAEVTPAPKPKK